MTALTFGWASAAEVSIDLISAWATGLRRMAPYSMPGMLDVVDVVAVAAEEPGVFLAEHAAEPDGVAAGAGGCFGDGHQTWRSFGWR